MKKVSMVLMAFYLALVAVPSVWAEGNDDYSVLLIQSDNLHGDLTFVDSSVGGTNHTVNPNGDVHHSTTQVNAGFGSSSIYFDGGGDYFSVLESTDFDIYGADFTIDFWMQTSSGDFPVLDIHSAASSYYSTRLYVLSDGTFQAIIGSSNDGGSGTTTLFTTTSTVNDGQWHHIALVSEWGGNSVLYIDGVNAASGATGTRDTTLGMVLVGAEWYADAIHAVKYTGYLDDLRISKGIARWVTDFTPPTVPYSEAISNPCDATYDFFKNTLSVPCFEINGKRYGFDMELHGFNIDLDSVIEHPEAETD